MKAEMPKPRQKTRVRNHTGDYSAALSTEKRPRGAETAYKPLRGEKLWENWDWGDAGWREKCSTEVTEGGERWDIKRNGIITCMCVPTWGSRADQWTFMEAGGGGGVIWEICPPLPHQCVRAGFPQGGLAECHLFVQAPPESTLTDIWHHADTHTHTWKHTPPGTCCNLRL